MIHWNKVSPGRYKHPRFDAWVQYDLTTHKWTLQCEQIAENGNTFILKREALEAFPLDRTVHMMGHTVGNRMGTKKYA